MADSTTVYLNIIESKTIQERTAAFRHRSHHQDVLTKVSLCESGFGGLGLEVTCWPLVPKFAGSNPAEAVGFFRAKKSSARVPSEGK